MIYLYSGTPGSGKSLHTAQVVKTTLEFRKKPVICNFRINLDKIKEKSRDLFTYIPNWELSPDKLVSYSNDYFGENRVVEGALTLVIDECQLIFNSRTWNAKGRDDWLAFFTQHRHYGYDIILICQFDLMIDKQIRSLIEYERVHRKVGNFGLAGKIVSLFSFGKLFVSVERWYPMGERTGCTYFRADKKYYSLYDSYNEFKK